MWDLMMQMLIHVLFCFGVFLGEGGVICVSIGVSWVKYKQTKKKQKLESSGSLPAGAFLCNPVALCRLLLLRQCTQSLCWTKLRCNVFHISHSDMRLLSISSSDPQHRRGYGHFPKMLSYFWTFFPLHVWIRKKSSTVLSELMCT